MGVARPVFAGVVVVVSLGMLGLGVPGVLGAKADEALVPVEGTVLEVSANRKALLVRSNSQSAPTHETRVHVTYRYAYQSVDYTGDRYAFDELREGLTDEREARARVEALQPPARITVLVDPEAPERAVLVRRVLAPPLAFSGIGILALVISAGVLLQWLLAERARRRFEGVS